MFFNIANFNQTKIAKTMNMMMIILIKQRQLVKQQQKVVVRSQIQIFKEV